MTQLTIHFSQFNDNYAAIIAYLQTCKCCFSYGINHKTHKVFNIVIKYRFINDT